MENFEQDKNQSPVIFGGIILTAVCKMSYWGAGIYTGVVEEMKSNWIWNVLCKVELTQLPNQLHVVRSK